METTSKTLKSRLLLIVAAFALSLSVALLITPWSQASADELTSTPTGTVYFSLSDQDQYVLSKDNTTYLAYYPVSLAAVYYEMNNPSGASDMYDNVAMYTDLDDDDITLMELFAYMHTKHYSAGWETGATITGSAHATYFTEFWGHDENLTYYVNGIYPLDPSLGPNMGATSDQIILTDGDFADVQMLDDWDFFFDDLAGYHFFLDGIDVDPANIVHEYTATANTPFTVSLGRSWTEDIWSNLVDTIMVEAEEDITVYCATSLYGSPLDTATTNSNGEATFDDLDPGTYYIWIDGQIGATTSSIVSSPAYAKVIVS